MNGTGLRKVTLRDGAVSWTEHIIPNPGRDEEAIEASLAEFRAQIASDGGRITSERRVRNEAFDPKGVKTSTVFRVAW